MKQKNSRKPLNTSQKLQIAGIILFLLVCAGITLLAWPYIQGFIKTPEAFPQFVKENGLASVFLYLALQTLQVVVAVIPGEVLEVAAGVAFGWFGGLLLAEAGVAIGTIIIFTVFRRLGKPLVRSLLGPEKLARMEKLSGHPRRDGIIFFIFLIPGLPKDLLTYAAAFFDMTVWRFLLLTLIARIPSILTSTIAGRSIIQKDYKTAVIIFIITSIVAVLGFLFSEKIMKLLEVRRENK